MRQTTYDLIRLLTDDIANTRCYYIKEAAKTPSIVMYTDYSAAVPVSRQTSLSASFSSSFTNKLNLRLVRASQYLSMLDLSIRHKARKANLVSDTLSRLLGSPEIAKDGPATLERLYESAPPQGSRKRSQVAEVSRVSEVPVCFSITLAEIFIRSWTAGLRVHTIAFARSRITYTYMLMKPLLRYRYNLLESEVALVVREALAIRKIRPIGFLGYYLDTFH